MVLVSSLQVLEAQVIRSYSPPLQQLGSISTYNFIYPGLAANSEFSCTKCAPHFHTESTTFLSFSLFRGYFPQGAAAFAMHTPYQLKHSQTQMRPLHSPGLQGVCYSVIIFAQGKPKINSMRGKDSGISLDL